MIKRIVSFPRGLVKQNDDGVALVTVIGLAMVMLILLTMALSFSTSGMVKARSDQNWNAALAAATAGVDEYASRLSTDSTYQKFGNPAAPFTARNKIATLDTVSLPTGVNDNPAFGINEGGSWATLAGSGGRASYRYEVDNSLYSTKGVLRIRSTGKVGDVTRSIIADLKQSGFINFLYFTQYELMDPQLTGNADCTALDVTHAPHKSECTEIQFGSSDRLHGPIHSNDQIKVCGSVFTEGVTSSTKLTPNFVNACTGTAINWGDPLVTGPVYKAEVPMPLTNLTMANETRVDLPDDVPRPGCMYTGPTSITFTNDGKMRVVSPWTKFTQPSYTAGTPSKNPPECGTLSGLNSTTGALVTVPDQNLIYVQTVPTPSPGVINPNSWATTATPVGVTCLGSGKTSGWSYGATRYPLANEVVPPELTTVLPAYSCKRGDVFVKGDLKGEVTVASDTFVYVTGSLKYVDPASDILGLVGENAVWVYNPMKSCSGSDDRRTCTQMTPAADLQIDAAILSVGHTFQVQNYSVGGHRGDLIIHGAIAQQYRGTVAKGDDGYSKDYWYDTRFLSSAPPKFLQPTSTTYGVTQIVDVARAFDDKGRPLP